MKLAFIGFGELGRYQRDTVTETLRVPEADHVYFDDNLAKEGAPRAFPFNDWSKDDFAGHTFFVSLGYRHLTIKRDIVRRLVELGRDVPPFVCPSAYVHPTVKLGPGCWLYPGVNMDRDTVVGLATTLSNGAIIPHDCRIGEGCWFGASVTLSGKVTVGDNTFIASGTTVSNALTIGSNVIVGLGTCVTKNIEDGKSVIGNPMRILERPIKLV